MHQRAAFVLVKAAVVGDFDGPGRKCVLGNHSGQNFTLCRNNNLLFNVLDKSALNFSSVWWKTKNQEFEWLRLKL